MLYDFPSRTDTDVHGASHPAYIHRSKQPYSIDAFERIATTNFSYSQPWHLPGRGFFFLHTRYSPGRNLFWMTSAEIGSRSVGFRKIVFGDLGWAGDRHNFSHPGRPLSGAGVGASFMDGLIRIDLAKGIYPEKSARANLYVEARF